MKINYSLVGVKITIHLVGGKKRENIQSNTVVNLQVV